MTTITPIVSTVELVQGCGGCPTDWTVRDHLGREVYVRYRFGRLAVYLDGGNELLWSTRHGDDMAGFMDDQTMIRLTAPVLQWVEHRLHFPPS